MASVRLREDSEVQFRLNCYYVASCFLFPIDPIGYLVHDAQAISGPRSAAATSAVAHGEFTASMVRYAKLIQISICVNGEIEMVNQVKH